MKNWQQMMLLLGLLCFSQFLSAQRGMGNRSAEERIQQQVEAMKERLTLSDAQVSKVEAVLKASAEKMKIARDTAEGDWSAMRGVMLQIREEQNTEMQKYLTEAQFTEYEKMVEEQRATRRERMKNRRGDRNNKL